MNIHKSFRFIWHWLVGNLSPLRRRPSPPPASAAQLTLDLEQPSASGLRLREALLVRSAEYWLCLGQPDLASQQLAELSEDARQHPWARRVQLAAHRAAKAHAL